MMQNVNPVWPCFKLSLWNTQLTRYGRSCNPTRIGLRDPQELHFHTRPTHGRRDTKSRQGAEIVGLADRQAKAEDGQGAQSSQGSQEQAVNPETKKILIKMMGLVKCQAKVKDVRGAQNTQGSQDQAVNLETTMARFQTKTSILPST